MRKPERPFSPRKGYWPDLRLLQIASSGAFLMLLAVLFWPQAPVAQGAARPPDPAQIATAAPIYGSQPTPCPPKVTCLTPLPPTPDASPTASLPIATKSGVKLTAEAGFASYARAGNWLPLYLSLENNGLALNGELVISVLPGNSANYGPYGPYGQKPLELYTSLYVQKVELAQGARKGLTMYIPLVSNDLFSRNIRVELRGTQGDGTQKLLATGEADLKFLLNQLLVGLLAPNSDLFQFYDNIVVGDPTAASKQNPGGGPGPTPTRLALARLETERLPGIGQAWSSLNVLLVQDFDLGTLSAPQKVALESWVRNGGLLILSGGASAGRSLNGLPPSLRPVALPGPGEGGPLEAGAATALQKLGGGLPLPPATTGTSFLTRLQPVPEATVTARADNTPLVVNLRRGAGAVVITAFDLSESRFTTWDGSSFLWENLLGNSPLLGYGGGGIYGGYGLNSNLINGGSNVLTNIPGLDIPSLKVIALLAFLYILIAGPVNYFVLKRLGRRELSWITLPVFTLLFTLGIYLFALRDKGTEIITSSVNIVRLDARDARGGPLEKSALGLVGVFAPSDSTYRLELPPNTLTSAVPSYIPNYAPQVGPGGPGSGAPPTPTPLPVYQPPVGLRIVQGDRPQVDLLGMSQWSFRSLIVEGTVRLEGTLAGELAQRDGRIQGQVTNRTGQPLSDVTVLGGFGFAKIGHLAPGQTAPVDFPNVYGQPNNIFGSYQQVYYGGSYAGPNLPNSSPTERTEARKRELLNLIYSSLPGAGQAGGFKIGAEDVNSPQVAVVGWSDQPLLRYNVNGRQIGGNDLTMVVADVALDPTRSNEILPGEIRAKIVDKQETVQPVQPSAQPGGLAAKPGVPPGGASLEVGTLILEYALPQLSGRTPVRLVLQASGYLYRKGGYGPQQGPRYTVELYNFKSGQWEAVPVTLAPPACLESITPYTGGPVTVPLSGFSLPPGASQACLNAVQGGKTGYPVPALTATPAPTGGGKGQPAATATLSGSPSSGTPSAKTTPKATIAAPPTLPLGGYPGGPADGFVVLQSGPGFDLAAYLSPDGKVRVRYNRDATMTDVMLWSLFSIGVKLQG